MHRTEPCWTSMSQTASVGLYLPDSVEHSGLAVHILNLE
jgi:hypothetical protein